MDSRAPAPTLPGSAHDGVTSSSRWWWKSGGAGRWSPGHLVNCHLVGGAPKTAVRLLLASLSQLEAEVDGRAPPAEKTAAKYISRAASRADSWFTSFDTSLLKYFPSPGQWWLGVVCGMLGDVDPKKAAFAKIGAAPHMPHMSTKRQRMIFLTSTQTTRGISSNQGWAAFFLQGGARRSEGRGRAGLFGTLVSS